MSGEHHKNAEGVEPRVADRVAGEGAGEALPPGDSSLSRGEFSSRRGAAGDRCRTSNPCGAVPRLEP